MKVVIIGAGVTGLTAGYEISRRNCEISIFEKEDMCGGLAGSLKLENAYLEKYYHHFFSTDTDLLNLIEEIDLSSSIFFKETKIGFFYQNKIYPFTTPKDLLKFKPLTLIERIKFGISVLYFQKLKNWRELDKITVKEWYSKYVGKNIYEIIWQPLLKSKFGNKYEEISAAWMWGRIHPRSKSRTKGMIKEKLGYLKGGFHSLIERLEEKIKINGGTIQNNSNVEKILIEKNKVCGVIVNGKTFYCDIVISTVPAPILLNLCNISNNYTENLKKMEYQSVICLVLELTFPLSNIYWLNTGDSNIAFAGIIEHTNFIDKKEYNSNHIVYLFNYLNQNDPLYDSSRDQLLNLYLPSLKKIFPSFKKEWIISLHIFKDKHAAFVFPILYANRKPAFRTPVDGLYMAGINQIYPEDRSVNNCISIAKIVSELVSVEKP